MSRMLSGWLDALDDPARAAIFAARETNVTVRDRKLIAGDKLRSKEAETLLGAQAEAPAGKSVMPPKSTGREPDRPTT